MNVEIPPRRRRGILILLALIVLVVVMDMTILNVALRTIQQDLGASSSDLQWVLDSYLISFAALLFTAGVIADRYGRRRILLGSLVLFGVTSALAGYAGTVEALILWRTVMGVGAAAIPTVTLAIIMSVFPPAERPKAVAVWAGAAGVAFAVGPLLGGLLLEQFWWGSVFLINVPVVIVGVVLVAMLVPESRGPITRSIDPLGVVLSAAGVGLLVYGIVVGGEDGDWGRPAVYGSIVAGLALMAVLVLVERRMSSPALDVRLLTDSRFAAGSMTIALNFFALLGAIFVTTFYFQAVRDYSPVEAGLMMFPIGVGVVVMAPRCPKLVMRHGPARVVAAGSAGVALAAVGYCLVGADTPLAVLVVLQLLTGLGWGSVMAPSTGALMSAVPPAKAAAGQGLSQTLRQVAGALGVAVVGSVLNAVYRSSLGSAADVLPEEVREQAAGSLGATVRAAEAAGLSPQQMKELIAHGVDAFVGSMQVGMGVVAVVALVAVVVAMRWLPNRPPMPPGAPGTAAPGQTAVSVAPGAAKEA